MRRLGELSPARRHPPDQVDAHSRATRGRRLRLWRSSTPSDVSGDGTPPALGTAADPEARLLLTAAVLAYIALFLYWTFRHHDGLGTGAFDLGIFDQGVWLLSRLESPFITINGRNLFGTTRPSSCCRGPSSTASSHRRRSCLPARRWPSALAHGRPSSSLGRSYAARCWPRSCGRLPPPSRARLDQLQRGLPSRRLRDPARAACRVVAHSTRWVGYGICIVALLLVREDVALLTFPLGTYVALRHHRRVGWVTCAVSAAYLFAAIWLIIPPFLGSENGLHGTDPLRGAHRLPEQGGDPSGAGLRLSGH